MKRAALPLSILTATLSAAPAFAAVPSDGAGGTVSPSPVPQSEEEKKKAEEEAAPQLVSFARDSVGGHFQLGASGVFAAPFGSVAKGVKHTARAGSGFGAGLDAGFGVGRYVMLGAYGEHQWLGASKNCASCSGTSLGAGIFARYHVAQGLRMDPWVSYGFGFRNLQSESDALAANYTGLDWMRLQMGATWFATPNFGFAPFLQLDAGSILSRPEGERAGGTSWRFQLGLRLAIDVPGK